MSECCGKNTKCLVYACSGASNVGQLSNEAAKTLDSTGEADMACLAGLGGHIAGMLPSAESGSQILVIDGCILGCGKKIIENLGIKDYGYIEITSLGIEKEHNVCKTPSNQVKEVVNAAKSEIKKLSEKGDIKA
ncbi:MAG: putative zinc-binding protein [Candidatus Riflebacteria bacterium]|nr:putative zinc-binding protein [Candidatus Riflebacteria bacterium]